MPRVQVPPSILPPLRSGSRGPTSLPTEFVFFLSIDRESPNTKYEDFDVTGSRHVTRRRQTNLLSTVSVAEGWSRPANLASAQATSVSDALPKLSGSFYPAAVRNMAMTLSCAATFDRIDRCGGCPCSPWKLCPLLFASTRTTLVHRTSSFRWTVF